MYPSTSLNNYVYNTDELGPKSWGAIFFLSFLACWLVGSRIAACCLSAQRNKLRDEYEDELRRGGKLTNRLLLPQATRVEWNPYARRA